MVVKNVGNVGEDHSLPVFPLFVCSEGGGNWMGQLEQTFGLDEPINGSASGHEIRRMG